MEPTRLDLENELDRLHLVMNGPIKSIAANWHDVMFKVRVAKMGKVTLTDKDISAVLEALSPLTSCIIDLRTELIRRFGSDNPKDVGINIPGRSQITS